MTDLVVNITPQNKGEDLQNEGDNPQNSGVTNNVTITKLPLSFDRVYQQCRDLVYKLANDGHNRHTLKGIIMITRGGLVPGGILGSMMEIKNMRVISFESDTPLIPNIQNGEICMKYPGTDDDIIEMIFDGQGWLVIDAISVTGEKLKYLKRRYNKAIYATLMTKPAGEDVVDYTVDKVEQNVWVDFPWEV